jgi:site-specific recombinase XerD
MTLNPRHLPPRPHLKNQDDSSTDAVSAFLEPLRGAASFVNYGSAARHFLHWLDQRRISLVSVDATTIARFEKHRCNCPRYSPAQLRDPVYLGRVGRFVRFLEDRGDIPVIDSIEDVRPYLSLYADHLTSARFSPGAWRIYYSAAEHFAAWLRLSRLQWCGDVDDAVVERFVRHACRCSLCRKGAKLQASGEHKRRRGAYRFLAFLKEQGAIPITVAAPPEDLHLSAYPTWLRQHCGATDQTIARYVYEVSRWVPTLGADPAIYDATTIRNVVLSQEPNRSRSSVRLTATVLRSYFRFLAARGECRPELYLAVPSVTRRHPAPLPRHASAATIERIIASCDAVSTPVGLRDRAIILLLARLGLRAGDIRRLRLDDIDWANALIYVHGKGRRTASLPLPQDAGDAVLAYIEHGRPMVAQECLFLRVQAPHTPLASSAEISGIVSRVLARGGITGVPTGAHMFRHSLATTMLRTGASLESVGAVLRHQSPGTTAIYAKVDAPMLMRVAQPWPGDASC